MGSHSGEFLRFVTLHIAHRDVVEGAKTVDTHKTYNDTDYVPQYMSICRREIKSSILKLELQLQEILVFCKSVKVL